MDLIITVGRERADTLGEALGVIATLHGGTIAMRRCPDGSEQFAYTTPHYVDMGVVAHTLFDEGVLDPATDTYEVTA